MKVLLVLAQTGSFRLYDSMVLRLAAEGHQVTVLVGTMTKLDLAAQTRAMVDCQRDLPECRFGLAFRWRQIGLRSVLAIAPRELVSYAVYLKPQHPNPEMGRRRTAPLPLPLRVAARSWVGRAILARTGVQNALRWIDRVIPPSPSIMSWLRELQPDVVLASPYIMGQAVEVEYVKAAKALGIPTAACVSSWDNLTTKGTFPLLPDQVFVWNEVLAEEAVTIHAVPRERIVVTGAPVFDFWFDTPVSLDRESFCAEAGVDPSKPIIVFVGSSLSIGGDETAHVRQLAAALHTDEATRDATLLVRPHPWNASFWRDFTMDGVVVWPRFGNIPDTRESRQQYVNTVRHADVVVGINTSAMVEVAIADRPCVTILTEQYERTQKGRAHFFHLLNAKYMETADSVEEGVRVIGRVLGGADQRASERRRFVQEFVRPAGLNVSPSSIMASALEKLAGVHAGREPVTTKGLSA